MKRKIALLVSTVVMVIAGVQLSNARVSCTIIGAAISRGYYGLRNVQSQINNLNWISNLQVGSLGRFSIGNNGTVTRPHFVQTERKAAARPRTGSARQETMSEVGRRDLKNFMRLTPEDVASDYNDLYSGRLSSYPYSGADIASRAAMLGIDSIEEKALLIFASSATPSQFRYALDNIMQEHRNAVPAAVRCMVQSLFYQSIVEESIEKADAAMEELDLLRIVNEYAPEFSALARIPYATTADEVLIADLYCDAVCASSGRELLYDDGMLQLLCNAAAVKMCLKRSEQLLKLAGEDPMKRYVDEDPEITWCMAFAAMNLGETEMGDKYLRQTQETDSAYFAEKWVMFCNGVENEFLANPSADIEVINFLLKEYTDPHAKAADLAEKLYETIPDAKNDFAWREDAKLYKDTIATIHAVAQQALAIPYDEYDSRIGYLEWLRLSTIDYDGNEAYGVEAYKNLYSKMIELGENDEFARLIAVASIFSSVYLQAHGLDNPKAGVKFLKKYEKFMTDSSVSKKSRADYWNYLAQLYQALGKTKDARKAQARADAITGE